MTDLLIPPWIIPEREEQEWLDEGTAVFPAQFVPGLMQRQSFGGLRLKLSRTHTVRQSELGQLLSILNLARGRYNAVRTKVHMALRGSMSTTQLLSNNTFSSGTTGWTKSSTVAHTVSDRVLRAERSYGSGNSFALYPSAAVSVSQYVPYEARFFVQQGRGNYATGFSVYDFSQTTRLSSISTAYGYFVGMSSRQSSTIQPALLDETTSGLIAGDYLSIPWVSLSRCALVDAGVNLLTYSDEFDNASWTKTRSSITANATTAPDGTTTADALVEDSTASNNHIITKTVTVSSSAADYAFTIAMKANTRTWVQMVLTENTSSTNLVAWFNLSTGAVGSTNTGANWSNLRTFSRDHGDGWYVYSLVGRKTNAATSMTVRLSLSNGDGVIVYTGDGSSSIYIWRGTFVQSSVPTRLVQTTSSATASSGSPPSSGATAMYTKGWPASTTGLLLLDDIIEINSELKRVTAPVNSDASGLAYLQFEPALVRAPSNDDPIIVTDPMGKFVVSNIKVSNKFGTNAVVTYDLEHIYE